MPEEKEKNKKEKCPLCEVSEETLARLKTEGKKKEKNKKTFWKLWAN